MKRLPSLLIAGASLLALTLGSHAATLTIWHETFNSVGTASTKWESTGTTVTTKTDVSGWTIPSGSVYTGQKGVRVGAAKTAATFKSPAVTPNNRSNGIVVTVNAAAYYGAAGTQYLKVVAQDASGTALATFGGSSSSGGLTGTLTRHTTTDAVEIPTTSGYMKTFTIPASVLPASGSVYLLFSCDTDNGNQNRLLLGDVLVQQDEASSVVATPLPAPTVSLSGTAGADSFTVTWNGVSGATGYTVACTGGTVLHDGGTATTATISGLASETQYTVSVVAKGDGTTTTDSPAGTLQVTTASAATPSVTLAAPSDLATSDITPVSFTATWTGDANADGYELQLLKYVTPKITFDNETEGGSSSQYKAGSGSVTKDSLTLSWSSDAITFRSTVHISDDTPCAIVKANGSLVITGMADGFYKLAFDYGLTSTSASKGKITANLVKLDNAGNTVGTVALGDSPFTGGYGSFSVTSPAYAGPCRVEISSTANVVLDNIVVGTFAPIAGSHSTAAESYSFTGLASGLSHTFKVRATAANVDATDWVRYPTWVTTRANTAPALALSIGGEAAPASITIAPGETLAVSLSATDAEDDVVTYAVEPAAYAACLSGAAFSWTPAEALADPVTLTFTATDAYGLAGEAQTITVAVREADAPPVVTLSASTVTVTAGEPVSVTVTTDKGVPEVGYHDNGGGATSLVADPENPGAYVFSWTPDALGSFEFPIIATYTPDGASESLTGSATLTVVVNSLAAPASASLAAEGTTLNASWSAVPGATSYSIQVYAEDTATLDFDEFKMTGTASWVASNGTFHLASGAQPLTWTTTDSRFCYSQTNPGSIGGTNEAASLTIQSGTALTLGDFQAVLGVSFKAMALNGSGSPTLGVTVSVVDAETGETLFASDELTAPNDTAAAKTDPTAVGELFAITLPSPVLRPSKVVFTAAGTGSTPHLVLDDIVVTALSPERSSTVSGTSITFANMLPATSYAFSVTATGAGATSGAANSPIVATAGNHPPALVLSVASASVDAGSPATVTVTASDRDGDEVTLAVSPDGVGTLVPGAEANTWTFSYTPSTVGTTTFTFTPNDGTALGDAASFTVTATLGALSVAATAPDCTAATVSWAAVPGADHYVVSGRGLKVYGSVALGESFDGLADFSGSGVVSNTVDNPSLVDDLLDNAGWVPEYLYRGNSSSADKESAGAARVGSADYAGSLTTPALDLSGNGGTFTLSFKARHWKNDAETIIVTLDDGEPQSVTLGATMETKTLSFTGGTATSHLRIAGTKKNNRFFLDDLLVVSGRAEMQDIGPETLTGTSYTATGLKPDTTYTFTVTAYADDDGTEVTTSATASVTTPEAPARTLILFR